MAISPEFNKIVRFLNERDVVKDSIFLPKNKKELQRIDKRTRFQNFLHWFIHIITFTLVPRNKDLDRVTLHILAHAKELDKSTGRFTIEQKNLLKHAFKNLRTIIRENGGRNEGEVSQRLRSINKINSLESVQELKGQPAGKIEIERIPNLRIKDVDQQKRILDQCLQERLPILRIITSIDNVDSLLPILSEETQAQLIKLVFKDISESNHKIHYEKFLNEAIKLSTRIWENALVFGIWRYHQSDGLSVMETLFPLIDSCKDEVHKWDLFDLVTRYERRKSAGGNSPGAFDRNRMIPNDVNYICMLSEAQRRRLQLEKYELQLSIFLAIKNRTFGASEMEKINNMNPEQKEIFLTFISSLCPNWRTGLPIEERAEHYLYFISSLEEYNSEPEILRDSIQKFYGRVDAGGPIDDLIELFKKMSYNVLKNHVVPCVIRNLRLDHDPFIRHPLPMIIEMIKLLKIEDARALIDVEWDIISQIRDEADIESQMSYVLLLLKYVDKAERLKDLLPDSFIHHTVGNDQYETTSEQIFNHLERYPWKLFLLLDNPNYIGHYLYQELTQWLGDHYPNCKEISLRYHPLDNNHIDLTSERVNQVNEKLQTFFIFAKNKQFRAALESFNGMENEIKGYLLTLTRQAPLQVLCEELPFMREAQLLASLLDQESNQHMRQTIAQGLDESLISNETLNSIRNLATEMKDALARDEEKVSLLEDFLRVTSGP